jgi:hypothetical protein
MCRKYLCQEEYRNHEENWMENEASLILEGLADTILEQIIAEITLFF